MSDPGARLRLAALWTGLLLVPTALAAAPLSQLPPDAIGSPIRQEFRGDEVSLVRTPEGAACVLSVTIDIEASRYLDPATAEPVPFDRIVRSRATSAQVVQPVPSGPASLRVQLKFAVHPEGPIRMTAGAHDIDLLPLVERPGDSVRLTDPADIAAVRAVLEAGGAVEIVARSRDTGRTVADRLEGGDFGALDACAAAHRDGVPEAEAPPTNILALAFTVRETPQTRASEQDARICRIEDPETPLYRGRLDTVSGFFSQTETIFATFAPDGTIDRVYIPGIFEGRRNPDGVLAAQLSVAANGNDPLRPAQVSGCLGAAPVAMCEESDPDMQRFGFCPGSLLAGAALEDAVFLSDFALDSVAAGGAAPGGPVTYPSPALAGTGAPFGGMPAGPTGRGGGGGGRLPPVPNGVPPYGGGPTPLPGPGPGPGPGPASPGPGPGLSIIPLQPTLMLLLTALAMLPLVRRRV